MPFSNLVHNVSQTRTSSRFMHVEMHNMDFLIKPQRGIYLFLLHRYVVTISKKNLKTLSPPVFEMNLKQYETIV